MPVLIDSLHKRHPHIRAEDWRSPLIARLTDEAKYSDGNAELTASYRGKGAVAVDGPLSLSWSGLRDDYDRCINTYQAPVLTEFAALGMACVLVSERAGMEITEVTKRGEKVDYWLGDRELLLEVSGTGSGDLAALCEAKAKDQLQQNPFNKDGFVCVSRFAAPAARLWYYEHPESGS